MPVTVTAAALTDRYRQQVLDRRSAIGQSVAASLLTLNLDASRADITAQLLAWQQRAGMVLSDAQLGVSTLSGAYLTGYLLTSGVPATPTSPLPQINDGRAAPLLTTASKGLLWRLTAGRAAALSYGASLAVRAAADVVTSTAVDALNGGMRLLPAVTGWRRVTEGSTCRRCSDAGTALHYPGDSFYRHPHCHCTQEPVLIKPARFARPRPVVVRP